MRIVGRYALHDEIAAGGMATVHFGRLLGPVGFSRTVAIKRLHPQFAKDPEFVSMFLDEARLAARIRHPNVVPTLDVVALDGELFLVMDYVQGESLSRLARVMREKKTRIPLRIVTSIVAGLLHGLHAAHEARNERGEALGIVHRDVSPQNVLVRTDGVARVLDFGVAKAAGRVQTTRDGQLKGKLAYMAPEQLSGHVTRQSDVYAASIVLWEALTNARLFAADDEAATFGRVLTWVVEAPSKHLIAAGETLDAEATRAFALLDVVTLRGLDRDATKRYATAREMAAALEHCIGLASPSEVGEWVELAAVEVLARRANVIAEIESNTSSSVAAGPEPHPTVDAPSMRRDEPGDIITRDALNALPAQPAIDAVPAGGGASQLSTISVSRAHPDSASVGRKPRRTIVLALLVAAALSATYLVVRPKAPSAESDVPPSSSQAASTPSVSTQTPTATLTAATTTITITTVFDAGPAPPRTRPTTPAKSAATATPIASAKKPGCDPPYTVDSDGRKHFKAECLR